MALEGTGSYQKRGGRYYLYIPSAIGTDSQFPLSGDKGQVKVKVENGKIIVEPSEE